MIVFDITVIDNIGCLNFRFYSLYYLDEWIPEELLYTQ